MPSQKGGDLLTDVRNLAVPFGILLAKNGLDYVMSRNSKKSSKAPSKPKKSAHRKNKTPMKGGSDGCVLCAAQSSPPAGGASRISQREITNEFKRLSNDLQELLESYQRHLKH